jgi:hypothetical protein
MVMYGGWLCIDECQNFNKARAFPSLMEKGSGRTGEELPAGRRNGGGIGIMAGPPADGFLTRSLPEIHIVEKTGIHPWRA